MPVAIVVALVLAQGQSSHSTAVAYGWIAAALVLAFGIITGRLLGRQLHHAEDVRADAAALAARPLPGEVMVTDRQALVAACIEASDAVATKALRAQLLAALAAAGVTPVEVPANSPFDPTQHKAADTIPTDSENLAGLVAETERPGFIDRGERIRWPEVVVYRLESGRTSVA